MIQHLTFALLALFALSVNARIYYPGEHFELCPGGSKSSLIEIDIPACPNLPCTLYKGLNYTMLVSIIPDHGHPIMNFYLSGIVAGIEVPWPGAPSPNVCPNIVFGKCPYVHGDWIDVSLTLYIEPSYPSVDAISKWVFRGAEEHTCFRIPFLLRNA